MRTPPAPFTHAAGSHVTVEGAELYHEVVGDPAKPALLLLHGGLGNVTDFNPVAGALLQEFRLVGLDMRGHGKSSLGSAPLTYARCEADVIAVLGHLGVKDFSVLGFSDGGIVGYRLAANLGARVTSLVALGAQWRLSAADPAFELLGGLTPEAWEEMFPASRPYYESVNPSPDFAGLVKRAVALWTDLGPSAYPGDRVRSITTPTLLVRGDSDPMLSLPEAAELQATLPGASLFNVPFAGHEVHVDAPELFLAVVKDFLQHPRHRAPDA